MGSREMLHAIARRTIPRIARNLARDPGATANWLRHEAAYRLGRTVACPLRDDWAPRVHPASAAFFREQGRDPDQRRELADFVPLCAPDMVLFDIGASHGVFTLAALRYGGPGARVVAVDPSPTSNRALRINVALAGGGDRVAVVEAAAGADEGELEMLTTGPAGNHYLVAAEARRPDARRVPQYTIPGLAARRGLVPTHVKVDVEGFEDEVLRGAEAFLREHRPLLFLELHVAMLRRRGIRPAAVLERVASCGYVRVEHQGRPITTAEATAPEIARLICRPAPAPAPGPSGAGDGAR